MAAGGIYRKCEEPEDVVLKDSRMDISDPRRRGGFLSPHVRSGSERRSILTLYIVSTVLFVLWTIILAVMISKYSEISMQLEQLRANQTALNTSGLNSRKKLEELQSTYSTYKSKTNNTLQRMEADQNTLRKDVTKSVDETKYEQNKIWEITFALQEAIYKINGSACQPCPVGWLLHRGKCYSFKKQEAHWSFAKTACSEQGGHLVIINDERVQDFLKTHLKENQYWIGLDDMTTEKSFIWVDGTPVSYTKWAPGEPNDQSGEDCVVIKATGWWNDLGCGKNADGWICEKTWKC